MTRDVLLIHATALESQSASVVPRGTRDAFNSIPTVASDVRKDAKKA